MPKVNIYAKSNLSQQETFSKIKQLLEGDQDIKKFDPSFSVSLNDSNFSGQAAGKQFKGEFQIVAQGSTTSAVDLTLDLPLALYPFKGKIKSVLENKLEKALA